MPPEVRCKQEDDPDVSPAPREDEWIDYTPPRPGESGPGATRLSEAAVAWILDAMGVVRKQKGLRKVEHNCLDESEKKGLIRQ